MYAVTWRALAPILLLAFLLSGCTTGKASKPTLLFAEHQLVGKIWDVQQQAFIDRSVLMERVLASEYLLLGEKHDNPVHHQHQTWVIHELAKSRHQASVAFEMIDHEQGARLANQHINSVEQLIAILNHSKVSWDYDQHYKELFSMVIAAGYRMDSANLDSKQLMHTVMQGEDKLPVKYQHMLAQTPFSSQQMDALQEVINQSHCNLLDDNTSRKMILGQRVRDIVMTESLLNSPSPLKVLIAGTGHVRNDRAVPVYLRAQVKDANILSIGLYEVEGGVTAIADYAAHSGGRTLPYDIVWFTPQVKREDLCDKIKQHFKDKSVHKTLSQRGIGGYGAD